MRLAAKLRYVAKGDAEGLAAAVAQHGAAVAIINVPQSLLFAYGASLAAGGEDGDGGGVYDDPGCCSGAAQAAGTCLMHAVTITGFGAATDGASGAEVPYWTVKNSFSPSWGGGGYFKIARGKDTCGIEANAVVPIAV